MPFSPTKAEVTSASPAIDAPTRLGLPRRLFSTSLPTSGNGPANGRARRPVTTPNTPGTISGRPIRRPSTTSPTSSVQTSVDSAAPTTGTTWKNSAGTMQTRSRVLKNWNPFATARLGGSSPRSAATTSVLRARSIG